MSIYSYVRQYCSKMSRQNNNEEMFYRTKVNMKKLPEWRINEKTSTSHDMIDESNC